MVRRSWRRPRQRRRRDSTPSADFVPASRPLCSGAAPVPAAGAAGAARRSAARTARARSPAGVAAASFFASWSAAWGAGRVARSSSAEGKGAGASLLRSAPRSFADSSSFALARSALAASPTLASRAGVAGDSAAVAGAVGGGVGAVDVAGVAFVVASTDADAVPRFASLRSSAGGWGKVSSIGRSHHIRPTSVAAMTLANPAATGARASQLQSASNGWAAGAAAPRRSADAAVGRAAAARASARIAALISVGGAAPESGAWRSASRSQASRSASAIRASRLAAARGRRPCTCAACSSRSAAASSRSRSRPRRVRDLVEAEAVVVVEQEGAALRQRRLLEAVDSLSPARRQNASSSLCGAAPAGAARPRRRASGCHGSSPSPSNASTETSRPLLRNRSMTGDARA